jgi:hypothetical protein
MLTKRKLKMLQPEKPTVFIDGERSHFKCAGVAWKGSNLMYVRLSSQPDMGC